MTGRIASLNVSPGGVPKRPVPEAALTPLGLEGDQVRNTRMHGGPSRALCLYSVERIEALRAEGHAIFPGAIGENVTIAGLDWDVIVPGAKLQMGACLVEVTTYVEPCSTTAPYVSGDLKRYFQETRPGWSRVYARVISTGTVRVGDEVVLVA